MNQPGDSIQPPPTPGGAGHNGNPWEQRDRLGFGAGLIEAIKLFATDPSTAFARTRLQGDYVGPMLFAIILGWFCALISRIWQFVFQGSLLGLLPPEIRDQVALFMTGSAIGLIFEMLFWPILILIGLFVGTAIFHLSLLVVGGLNRSESGFEGTFRAVSYSHVAQLGQVIPVVGTLISMVWWVVLLTIGGATLHNTTRGRALAAVLIPVVVCCACVIFAVVMAAGVISSLDQ